MTDKFKRALFCGSRRWTNGKAVREQMEKIMPEVVIHGACPTGADLMADICARGLGIEVVRVPADWKTHGRKAGPLRNQQMLDEQRPDIVVAFGRGRGTDDMLRRARKAQVCVLHWVDPPSGGGM